MALDHEGMAVYQAARRLARRVAAIGKEAKPGRADLINQLRRSCASVPLNIAEGAGEYTPAEKARFYRYAKRSSTEVRATLDHMLDCGITTEHAITEAKAEAQAVTGSLVKLILTQQGRKDK